MIEQELITLMINVIDQRLRTERKRIADKIKDIRIYASTFPSSDPYDPFHSGEYLSKQDAEMLLSDIAHAILGEDE